MKENYKFNKKMLYFIICFLVVAVLAIVYFLFAPSYYEYDNRNIDFDSSEWKDIESVNNIKSPMRIRMVDDLFKKHKLLGMHKDQIDDLLGVPQESDYFRNYDYVYWLGPERSAIPIDSEWLGIKFLDNVVSEVVILKD